MQTPSLGAHPVSEGVLFCTWAPEAACMSVELHRQGVSAPETIVLPERANGYHWGIVPTARAGDAYGFRRESGPVLPDPASRAQQHDVHGLSLIVNPKTFSWTDAQWERPPFRDIVIYELHIGTFTTEGTFLAAAERLPDLQDLGVTAIQLMPIADFPGTRNWGYDGVSIYAPARAYGTPDDLRTLVDRAHLLGLAVILDVVYNHFGPDGNYLSAYSPHYFHPRHHTPWGNAFNFDGDMAGPVRRFFRENPVYWMEDFHIDGFRFDATHEIQDDSTRHILAEMTTGIHERGGYTIAEDSRNLADVISETGLGFDGVWADDFHHAARVSQTGEQHSYFQDFEGTMAEIMTTFRQGWLYCGQPSRTKKKPRGTKASHLPPSRFVWCLSNHDQTGNRALGERLNHLVSPEAYRALSVLLCLSPYTPMLFMGQEWSASTPFQFFTEHNDELGRAVTKGRRREFASFPEFANASQQESIPDPQAISTFEHSRLKWDEAGADGHRQIRELYRECLRLRLRDKAFRPADRGSWKAELSSSGAGLIHYTGSSTDFLLLFDVKGKSALPPIEAGWECILSSEDERFGGRGASSPGGAFFGPEALLFTRPK